MVKLLTRLLDPTDGSIELSGVDVREVPFAQLRRRVVFVPQEGFLWDTTLRENIRYGRPDAHDRQVDVALDELGRSAWIASLPGGVDTPVGSAGGVCPPGNANWSHSPGPGWRVPTCWCWTKPPPRSIPPWKWHCVRR